jgi:magnesium transporter
MTLPKSSEAKKVNLDFNKEFINTFTQNIESGNVEFINQTLKDLHEADVANLIENLNPDTRNKLIEIESFNIDPEIFIELNESIQSEVLQLLSIDSLIKIIKRLESDNAIKILENLSKEIKEKVLEKLPPKDKFLLQEGLSYPEDSAARIMQREFTAVPSNWTVGTNYRLSKRR